MTPYETCLSCYLLAVKILKSSIAEIDDMDLGLLLDLINVYSKVNSAEDRATAYIDDLL